MLIQKLSINGLKGIKKKDLVLGDSVVISGRNESGKTTVKDAILFALFGRVDNTTQYDGAINNDCEQIKVNMEFKHNGKEYILSRTKGKNMTTLTLNGRASSQEILESSLGIDYHGFLSAVCVGDFMKLENIERRRFLLSLFPAGDRMALWTELTGEADTPDLSDIASLNKQFKSEYSVIDSNIKFNTQRKSFLQKDIEDLKGLIQEAPTKAISSIEMEEAEVALQHIVKLEPRLADYMSQEKESTSTEEIAIRTRITELSTKRNEMLPPSMSDFEKLKGQYEEKKEKIEQLKNSMNCPTCKRPFENKAEQEREIDNVSREMSLLQASGKDILSEYNVLKKAYDDAIHLLSQQLTEQNNKLSSLSANKADKLTEIEASYRRDLESWRLEYNSSKEALDKIRADYNSLNMIKNNNEKTIEQIENKERELIELESKLKSMSVSSLLKKIEATGPKGIEFLELTAQSKAIKKLLPKNFAMEFIKKNKTNDSYKVVFELKVDGIEYEWLSTGKKIAVDYILSGLVNSKLKYDLAIVDNIESLTSKEVDSHDIKKRGQLIAMKAIDTDFTIDRLS